MRLDKVGVASAEVNGPKLDVEPVSLKAYGMELRKAWGMGMTGHNGLLICSRAPGCSSVPAQFVEKVVDNRQLPGADDLVVDVLADRQVEDAEAEGRENHRLVRRYRHPPGHHIVERAGQEIPVAGELFGQMRRGAGLQAVLDVVDDVDRGEQDLRCEVAQ